MILRFLQILGQRVQAGALCSALACKTLQEHFKITKHNLKWLKYNTIYHIELLIFKITAGKEREKKVEITIPKIVLINVIFYSKNSMIKILQDIQTVKEIF